MPFYLNESVTLMIQADRPICNEVVLYSGVQKIQRVVLTKTGSYFPKKKIKVHYRC